MEQQTLEDVVRKQFQRKASDYLHCRFVRKMTAQERKTFVVDYLQNKVITSNQIPDDLWPKCFMVLALGALSGWGKEELLKIGILYEYLDQAMPVGINGYPMFMSCRMMHIDDWVVCAAAIAKELERLDSLEV